MTPTAPGLQLFRGQTIAAGLVSVRPYPIKNTSEQLKKHKWKKWCGFLFYQYIIILLSCFQICTCIIIMESLVDARSAGVHVLPIPLIPKHTPSLCKSNMLKET